MKITAQEKRVVGNRFPTVDGTIEVIEVNDPRIKIRFESTGTVISVHHTSINGHYPRDPNRGMSAPEPSHRLTDPTIISYSRVSSGKQVSGSGLSQQKDVKILNRLSEAYNLAVDTRTFTDAGKSGFHEEHLEGDFGRIRELIDTGSIARGSILAITSLDRLSRARTNKAMELMLSVINRGIRIYTAMDDKLYSSDSPNLTADLIVSVIIMAQAHEESAKKSSRSIGAILTAISKHQAGERASDGNPISTGLKFPFWIDASKGSIKLDPRGYAAVRDYFQLTMQGWGTHRILTYLIENHPYREWKYNNIIKLHKQETLMGKYEVKVKTGEKYIDDKGDEQDVTVAYELTDYLPPVLTEQEYYQLVDVKKLRTRPKANSIPSPLAGVSHCAHCGYKMGSGKMNGKPRLLCLGYQKKYTDCKGLSVTSEHIEKAMLDNLGSINFTPIQTDAPSKLMYSELEEQLKQMQADYVANPMPFLIKAIADKQAEVNAKKDEYAALMAAHSTSGFAMNQSDVDNSTPEELRLMFKRSFEDIRIFKIKRSTYIVSLKGVFGWFHIYLYYGKVKRAGRIYNDTRRIDELMSSEGMLRLFIEDGRFNAWLSSYAALDEIEFNYDSLDSPVDYDPH